MERRDAMKVFFFFFFAAIKSTINLIDEFYGA